MLLNIHNASKFNVIKEFNYFILEVFWLLFNNHVFTNIFLLELYREPRILYLRKTIS